jgi:2-dehydro-3-deoxygluconokinase
MFDVVTVGEGMLRLSPPGHERIRRAHAFDLHVCGSQGNVACNMARLGLKTAFATKAPNNALGLLLRDHYLSCGVDASLIKFVDGARLGVNYIEFGATPRPSAVVYDRKNSAASTISMGDYNWDAILKGVKLAYTDGIFPGLSRNCSEAALDFIAAARRQGCLIGFDVNYREHLWSPAEARRVQSEIIKNVDILITTQWDSEIVFGYKGSYEEIIMQFHEEFGCKIVAITLREVYDVLRGAWNTMIYADGQVLHGQKHEIDVIDRFGAGDSWGSGFLYAYLTTGDPQYAMNFGNAFCALHHTIPGDVCHASVSEVETLMKKTSAESAYEVKR